MNGKVQPSDEELKKAKDKLEKAKQAKTRIEDHKNHLILLRGEKAPTEMDEDVGWCLEDYDWRLDDLTWTIDDINWDIRDTTFEIASRENVESTSKATFWTVLGAALFSLTSLIVGLMAFH
jgi:hypothetical protein